MGFLDAILGGNSAANTQTAVGQGIGDIWQGVTGANTVLGNTNRRATDAYTAGADRATDALTKAFGGARDDLIGYGGKAQAQLGAGRDAAVGTILGGNANYAPFAATGGSSNTMLGNALGLNGQAGHDAAEAAFRAGPGYEFTRDQAVDATARKMASLGMAGSGNTLDAIAKQASGFADQTYGNWLDRLLSVGNQGLTAAGGISTNNANAGNIQYNAGSTGAQLSQGLGTSLGSLGTGLGTALGGIQSSLGNALGGLQTQLGGQRASNILGGATSTANLGMQGAEFQDSADNANNSMWSGLLGGLGKIGAVGLINPSGLTAKL